MKYYHNPQCTKSRAGLEILKASKLNFTVKEYLKEPLEDAELEDLFQKVGKLPIECIRQKEPLFKELDLDPNEKNFRSWIPVVQANPKLLERPILVGKVGAVIGRPTENLIQFLNEI